MIAGHPGQPPRLGRLVFLLPLLSFFLCLGTAPLFDVDEGAFSEATREMFERGDFLFTYLNGEPRFDKPILVYWLQALGYLALGPTEWAFRLPSAICASLWAYATWHFARHRFGPDSALAALAVAATALGPFAIGRAATADSLLNLLLALTLFDTWRHLESRRRAPLLRAFVWMALGALTKGPIALIVPGAVSFLYCASRREWRRWAQAVFDPLGWLILVALVAPWYAHALATHGQAFIDGFILRHNVQRFTGTLEGHAGSMGYYLLVVPLLLLPWIGPLLTSLGRIRGDLATGLRRFLWIWAGFVVVFFSLSGTKLPHYALYGATPLFLLIAVHRDELRRPWLHGLAPTLGLAFLAALPLVLDSLASHPGVPPFYQAQLSRARELAGPAYFALAGGGLVLWLLIASRWRAPLWQRIAVGGVLQTVLLAALVVPYGGELLQGPIRQAGRIAHASGLPAVTWRFTAPSFSVYRQGVTPSRAPEAGELALVRADRLPGEGFKVVYRAGGVALVEKTAP
ncbi:MAG: glycosyltransferase family 39 protein [Rhodocyclaceae bacterium]|jgi:4-amino-4-deoxy-L-arabinose transferase-like glycosyltransferase|nr:glycosyltransferase family 39 protein [Rhodocyclaceae bacterium]